MPCDSVRLTPEQTQAMRDEEIDDSLRRLEASLATGKVAIGISSDGAIVFEGWEDRDGVTDVCAYMKLTADGSFELATAVAMAETAAGVTVNAGVVASGVHSHDGGKTWGKD